MEGSKGGCRKRITVRASKAQTLILQDAFTRSNITSPEELKTLSEKTGLPEKWIYMWFGRQRAKARKTIIDSGSVMSSSDLVLSPQEILEVKMEYRDSLVPRSSSPAVTVASVTVPTSDENVGQSKKAHPKKRALVRFRGAKKKQATVQNNCMEDEHTDLVVDTLGHSVSGSPSIAQSFISCGISHPLRLNESPLVTLPAFPLRLIAPPSRTPVTSANISADPYSGEDGQFGLSTNQSYRIYPALRTSEATTINDEPSPDAFKSSRAAIYQQGPMFRAHFYNNEAANYRNTHSNLGTVPALHSHHISAHNPGLYSAEPMFPASDGSGRQHVPRQVGLGEYFSQSLAPAIVLENTSKFMPSEVVPPMNDYSAYPSSSSVQYIMAPSTVTEGLLCPPYNSGWPTYDNTEDFDISAQSRNLCMEGSQAFTTFYNEALDPSLAPLKYLTDVLGRFRDQNGTYTKLVDLQEREELMKCLLDDELARRSPFQAAMGLVLLSKLGLEWDYTHIAT